MDIIKKQYVFNRVVNHLLTQKQKSNRLIDGESVCAYRGKDGLRCAIGCLIPNRDYRESMDNSPSIGFTFFSSNPYNNSISQFLYKKGYLTSHDDGIFLVGLQNIHDRTRPSLWKRELRKFAECNNLSTKILDKFK